MLFALLRLARPRDWIKNVFVLAPLPFALSDQGTLDPQALALGVAGFCLCNSATYALNDLRDAEADRQHPSKRTRPIAAGELSPTVALLFSLVLAAAGLALLLAADRSMAMELGAIYLGINLLYSLGAKHIALLDVFILSSGFVLRVLLGCALVQAAASDWLLLCTSSLALFLGFAKRRADVRAGLDTAHRPALAGYTPAFLDQGMAICAGIAICAYALYCHESQLLLRGRHLVTLPFVAYGVLDYLRLALTTEDSGSPVDVALRSRSSQLCALGWCAAVAWSLGLF